MQIVVIYEIGTIFKFKVYGEVTQDETKDYEYVDGNGDFVHCGGYECVCVGDYGEW